MQLIIFNSIQYIYNFLWNLQFLSLLIIYENNYAFLYDQYSEEEKSLSYLFSYYLLFLEYTDNETHLLMGFLYKRNY